MGTGREKKKWMPEVANVCKRTGSYKILKICSSTYKINTLEDYYATLYSSIYDTAQRT